MMEFITILLVIVTACIAWQTAFQNKSSLFEKRFKLYEEFSENMYLIYMLEKDTASTVIKTINPKNFEENNFQREMYRFYIDPLINAHKIIEGIKYVYINEDLKKLLMNEVYDHMANICYYLCNQYYQTDKEISENEYNESIKYLEKTITDGGNIKPLFDKELQLKNFHYYFNQAKHLICNCQGKRKPNN